MAGPFFLGLVAGFGTGSPADAAASGTATVIVVTFSDAGFNDVFAGDPRAYALASLGGAALVSQRLSLATTLQGVFGAGNPPYRHVDGGSMTGADGNVDSANLGALFDKEAAVAVNLFPAGETGTLIFVSTAPSPADVRAGDELGVVIVASGTADQIRAAMERSPTPTTFPSLTSDSTRRDGAVTTSDIAVTIGHLVGAPVPSGAIGAEIRASDAPGPFALYQRYRDQRRLTVPIGVAAAVYTALVALFALLVGLRGPQVSDRLRTSAAWAGISIVPLGLALLEVGRLPRLTYAGVIPFLIGVTAVLTTAIVVIGRRKGAVPAVVALGTVVLCVLAVEAAMDWPGAVTPLLGGSQLDGGRFFGLPNAFLGLVLGSAVSVALGLRHVWAAAALLFAVGIVIGSPWFGSDLGGAITLCAVAGSWWGVRSRASVVRTVLAAGASALVGTVLVVLTQRYLASSATHITHFAEGSDNAGGFVATVAERLR
ncbi:MAG: hypothetical protein QOG88_931, partial [Actinomycetota bacterium]|nr:hypothetical protein [Actinomycetota bacterium]